MKLTRKHRNLICDVLSRLQRNIDDRQTQEFVANLIRDQHKAERQYRSGWCSGRYFPRDFGPAIAARLFVAQHILGFAFDYVPSPSLKASLRLDANYVRAAAIAAEFEDVIRKQVTSEEAATIVRALDYSQLCEGEATA
jgi:hypothetical protein